LAVEFRWANHQPERLAELAAELLKLGFEIAEKYMIRKTRWTFLRNYADAIAAAGAMLGLD
jgi:hypothetical protein